MYNLILVDTETTGLLPCDMVELSKLSIFLKDKTDFSIKNKSNLLDSLLQLEIETERFRPNKLLNIEATKVHGLTLKDLVDCPNTSSFRWGIPKANDFIVAHNFRFDYNVIQNSDKLFIIARNRRIDTLGLARTIWKTPKVPNHKLDHLVRHFYPEVPTNEKLFRVDGKFSKSKRDIIYLYLLLVKILEELPNVKSWEEVAMRS
ncbi:MAG: 3'-5' exonuclease [Burkholderiales bacterium]